jgi:hypothetical protein
MGWPFGKKPREEWRDKPRAIESAIPRDRDRVGPIPPPPPTAHAPGVSVYAFDLLPSPHLQRFDTGAAGFFLEGEEGKDRSSALLVLFPPSAAGGGGAAAAGEAAGPPPSSPGDVFVWTGAARPAPTRPAASPSDPLEEIRRPLPRPTHDIRRDDLSGRGVSGITGLRLRHSAGGITVLRLGPPPGARWVFVGLSVLAVFAGKFTLVDGEDSKIVPAGCVVLVADPTATLYVEAGNDSALGVALGGASVVSALG